MEDTKFIEFEILEALNKEWTAFLNGIPEQMGDSVADGNRMFASRRAVWMRKMSVKYSVSVAQVAAYFVH